MPTLKSLLGLLVGACVSPDTHQSIMVIQKTSILLKFSELVKNRQKFFHQILLPIS